MQTATHEHFSSAILLVLFQSTTVMLFQSYYAYGSDCEVKVSLPWEERIFVPQGSSMLISCTADTSNESDIESSLEWSVRLPDREIDDNFGRAQKKILNERGFYELPPKAEAIRLVVNNTDGINGTVLKCAEIFSGQLLQKTTFLVYESILINVTQARGIAERSVNLSWTSGPETVEQIEQGIKVNYSLKIATNSGIRPSQSRQIQEPFYVFTALDSKDASPCEVYNFSVTATYPGATYTGTGCSVPSPVFTTMLPSLPNITRLESLVKYSLKKNLSGGVVLRVMFMSASYCEMYPVDGYVLEVVGPTLHRTANITQSSSNSTLSVNSLLDNQAYSFSVIVSNSVGNASTGNRTIYTTDVQTITVLVQEDSRRFTLQCSFMDDSNAQGCMVVLVSNFGTEKRNLTRSETQSVEAMNVMYPLSCYSRVYGYDIESDGSLGTLAVPGIIARNSSGFVPCVPEELIPRPSQNIPTWAIIFGIILVVALVSITFILVLVAYRLVRRCRTKKHSSYYHVSRPSPTSSAGPAPLTPPPAPIQHFTDDMKEPQPIYDQPERTTLSKEEHTYHVLEISTPRYQLNREDFGNRLIPPHDDGHNAALSPTHSESDSSACEPPPIYQDIADIPLVRDRHSNGRAGASGHDICLHSTELQSAPSQPPIYQEIARVSL